MKATINCLAGILLLISCTGNSQNKEMKHNELTTEEYKVIVQKCTEKPFSGEFLEHKGEGTYTCKRCNTLLFRSADKFDSGTGWPSFDDAIADAVKEIPDKDGFRMEIVCNTCGAHLGHVFHGEGFTAKNTRHCVNSVSLGFEPEVAQDIALQEAVFGGGCFWGVEYLFQQQPGVVATEVGFMGGRVRNPGYKEVCYTNTGHVEVVQISYDPSKTSYETLARYFFEIHDPTQVNRQGPDIGEQYQSVIFCYDQEQRAIAEKLMQQLQNKGFNLATELREVNEFWPAEDYHQDYYKNNGKQPYCHSYRQRF